MTIVPSLVFFLQYNRSSRRRRSTSGTVPSCSSRSSFRFPFFGITMSISQFPPPASPSPASSVRLWRPAAQRNLRNQWLKLSTCRKQWIAACSVGMSHANSLVNSYLSQTYGTAMNDLTIKKIGPLLLTLCFHGDRFVPLMKFGVLSDMFDIKKKALNKLYKQQVQKFETFLLHSY